MIQTENLGIMGQLQSSRRGDEIYEAYLEKHNMQRRAYPGDDYHVTLGFVEKVLKEDVGLFKNHIKSILEESLKGLVFKFGTSSTLASKNPFVVAFPDQETHEILCKINRVLLVAIQEFNTLYSRSYSLNELTEPEIFVPHMSLNGRYGIEILPSNISHVLTSINREMVGIEIPIDSLVID